MHQSVVRPARSLAPRRCHRPYRRRRPLPLLRRLPPQRSPAAQPTLPHAPTSADCAPPTPPASSLSRSSAREVRIAAFSLSGTFPPLSASISTTTRQSLSRPRLPRPRGALWPQQPLVRPGRNESLFPSLVFSFSRSSSSSLCASPSNKCTMAAASNLPRVFRSPPGPPGTCGLCGPPHPCFKNPASPVAYLGNLPSLAPRLSSRALPPLMLPSL